MTFHLTLAIMLVFGQIDEKQLKIRKRLAYAFSVLCVGGSLCLVMLDFKDKIWCGFGLFVLTELMFLICISVLHFKMRKLHRSAFKNERRSIKLQNIVFLLGSIIRDIFLVLLYENTHHQNAYMICGLLFLSCVKLSLPILLYMIVHCYTFK